MPVPLSQALGPILSSLKPLDFSWPKYLSYFARQLILPVIAIGVWFFADESWRSWAASLLTLWLVLMSFMAVRWRVLDKALKTGKLTDAQFRADPKFYLFGSPRVYVPVITLALAALVAVDTLFGH